MKTTAVETIREFYDQHADAYNELMDQEIDLPMYATALSNLAERIAALDGPVLDSSCGSGHMLARLRDRYTPGRQLIGVDLSPRMVAIARERLGGDATVTLGDMRELPHVPDNSCAALLSFFALHHVDRQEMHRCFSEWHRVLKADGQLLVATWEGEGNIDYGDDTPIVAEKHGAGQVADAARAAGFQIDACAVETVQEMEMDAVYLAGTKPRL